jgi:hypothetical protein
MLHFFFHSFTQPIRPHSGSILVARALDSSVLTQNTRAIFDFRQIYTTCSLQYPIGSLQPAMPNRDVANRQFSTVKVVIPGQPSFDIKNVCFCESASTAVATRLQQQLLRAVVACHTRKMLPCAESVQYDTAGPQACLPQQQPKD